jgi:hypothetical protein
VIARAIRLLLASGFLAAVSHVAPVAERAALGSTRVEDLAPEAIARPLGKIRAACRIDRLSHQLERQSACGQGEPSSDAHAQPPGILPDPVLTPGAIRATNAAEICQDRRTAQYRHWSRARDDRILAEYGLPAGPHPDFEIDHLISLDLGGADDDANLWPEEPRRSIEPVWNAERKDRLEWRMADMVCGGQLGLAAAQKAILDNWVDAYRTYVGPRFRKFSRSPSARKRPKVLEKC